MDLRSWFIITQFSSVEYGVLDVFFLLIITDNKKDIVMVFGSSI